MRKAALKRPAELEYETVERVSQRMLTVTLRGLERDGLIARAVHPKVPPRLEYTLTPLGTTLREPVRELVA
jgi:DNA-binding HxlR family transcriptional regulator